MELRILIVGAAIAGVAAVGVDLVRRAATHVAQSRARVDAGRALPLETLSHRLLPRLETTGGYRVIGALLIAVAAVMAFYAFAKLN